MIAEYLSFRKAKDIKLKFDSILPTGVKCKLTYDADSYEKWKLTIQNSFGIVAELSEKENDIFEIIEIVRKGCKRWFCSFDYSKHGLDYVYISIEVKK